MIWTQETKSCACFANRLGGVSVGAAEWPGQTWLLCCLVPFSTLQLFSLFLFFRVSVEMVRMDYLHSQQQSLLHDLITTHFKHLFFFFLTLLNRKVGKYFHLSLSVHSTLQSNIVEFMEIISLPQQSTLLSHQGYPMNVHKTTELYTEKC